MTSQHLSRLRMVFCPLILGGAGVFAQTSSPGMEPAKAASAEWERNADTQQRRASVRATLKSLPDGIIKTEKLAASERQLSPQERADLRQQLRQQ